MSPARQAIGQGRTGLASSSRICATGVIVVVVTLGLIGQTGLIAGGIGHERSTVLISLNGLRLPAGGRSS